MPLSNACKMAIRLGICGALSAAFQLHPFEVPYLLASDHISWIFVTALVVVSAASDCLGQSIVKTMDRALGTLLGGILGALMAGITYAISLAAPPLVVRCFVLVGLALMTALSFYFPAVLLDKSDWAKTHQYMFALTPITMGLVWLSPLGPDQYQIAFYRFFGIVIGAIVGIISLVITPPATTLEVVHQGVSDMTRKAADLVDLVCTVRISQQKLSTLAQFYDTEFEADDEVRKNYRSIAAAIRKQRSLIDFERYEPRCMRPSRLNWLSSGARQRYRLLIARMTRMNATAMALDSQLRTFCTLPALDANISVVLQNLRDRMAEMLREAARGLDQAIIEAQCLPSEAEGSDDAFIARVRSGMEELARAAHGGLGSAGSLGHAGDEHGLEPHIASIVGNEVERWYRAWAGSPFLFLMLHLSIQATVFYNDVKILLAGRVDDKLEGDETGDAEEVRVDSEIV